MCCGCCCSSGFKLDGKTALVFAVFSNTDVISSFTQDADLKTYIHELVDEVREGMRKEDVKIQDVIWELKECNPMFARFADNDKGFLSFVVFADIWHHASCKDHIFDALCSLSESIYHNLTAFEFEQLDITILTKFDILWMLSN